MAGWLAGWLDGFVCTTAAGESKVGKSHSWKDVVDDDDGGLVQKLELKINVITFIDRTGNDMRQDSSKIGSFIKIEGCFFLVLIGFID